MSIARKLRRRSRALVKPALTTKNVDPEAVVAFHCSFCGKTEREVKRIIAGPCVYICDECVAVCVDIITEEAGEK